MALVDTNVLLDLLTADPVWADWSEQQVNALARRDELLINDIVYAELSARAVSIESLDSALFGLGAQFVPMTRPALFLAGKAFALYRRQRGAKTGVLADFFIGSLAAVENHAVVTRDPRHIRTYFPTVQLISP